MHILLAQCRSSHGGANRAEGWSDVSIYRGPAPFGARSLSVGRRLRDWLPTPLSERPSRQERGSRSLPPGGPVPMSLAQQ